MFVDLHIHTSPRSGCAVSTEEEQIAAARWFGLGAIAISDHNRLVPPERLAELNARHRPLRIFGAIEVRVPNEDILVLGVADPEIERRKWSYAELHAFVRDRNGFLALCHPYRYRNEIDPDIERFTPDGVEIHSSNIGLDDEARIVQLAAKLGACLLCNSDAHWYGHVGIYANDFPAIPRDEADLIAILRSGVHRGHRDKDRVERFNRHVRQRERHIRRMLAEGKTAKDYKRETGGWTGPFDRVAMGKSYKI